MDENRKNRLKNGKIHVFIKCILVITVILSLILVLDVINITGKECRLAAYIANINFDRYGVVATIILTLGIYITTYFVQDYTKSKIYQDDSFDAMYLVLDVMKNSFLTLKARDADFIVELKKIRRNVSKDAFVDKKIQFLKMYPFKNYDTVIIKYIDSGLIPTSLAEKYIRYKDLFGKFVVQYIKDDLRYENTLTLMQIQLEKSIEVVREVAGTEYEKYIVTIKQKIF